MGITGREHEARRTMITLPREPFRGGQICGEQLEYGVVPGRLVFCGERKQHASFWCGEHDDQARDEYGRLPKMAPGNARGDVTVPVVLQWEPLDGSTDPVDPSPEELAAYEAQFPKFHTHYSPYGAPRQVPGTLLDCAEHGHDPEGSELFADYMYSPRLVPSEDTGLPVDAIDAVFAAYLEHKALGTSPCITDAVRADGGYLVTLTIRTGDGTGWHHERFHYVDGVTRRVIRNPHPGYAHEPPWCANCGY